MVQLAQLMHCHSSTHSLSMGHAARHNLKGIRYRKLTLTALAVPAFSTCPCVGFFWTLAGRRMPPIDFSSLTSTFTRTLSPTGATVLYCSNRQEVQAFASLMETLDTRRKGI